MGQIAMVDLISQYRHIENEIAARFSEICESAAFIGGKYVNLFSDDLAAYLGINHVVPCANGTDALQLALMALDLKPGDEVITTSFTFVATAEVIALLNLKPVFADINPQTFNMDPTDLEHRITERTKCIIPVHLFGQSADMQPIVEIAKRHNVPIVEDNAQAIGSRYESNGLDEYTGTIGAMGTCSFFPSKNLGCYGDGGAITTNDDELAFRLRMIANHGSSKRYYHQMIGVNSRLDNLQAAVLHTKLKFLDTYNTTRRWAAQRYDEALDGIEEVTTPYVDDNCGHVFHQYTIRAARDRDELSEFLKSKGIANAIYYPIPLHLQEGYQSYGFKLGDLPETERACKEVLSLPIHSEMTEEIIITVTDAIKDFYA